MLLSGKSVLITGASSGIGRSVAAKLAGEDCKIAILSRSTAKLEEFAAEYSRNTNRILPLPCDITKKEDVFSAFHKVIDEFGGVDIAILNAGTSHRIHVEDFSSEKGEEIINVNLTAKIYFLEKLIPYFIQKGNGIIVGVSSLADTRGFPRSASYNASKAGLSKLLESLRIELHDYGIKVITVRPGFVKTPMTDKNEFYMPMLMKVDKAAEIIVDGIKKEKRKIQFPLPLVIGTFIIRLMPDALFEYMTRKHLEGLKRKHL
jgi:short-subunit dehydrogenase